LRWTAFCFNFIIIIDDDLCLISSLLHLMINWQGILGEKSTAHWRENGPRKWQNFRFNSCSLHVIVLSCLLLWNCSDYNFGVCIVWAFDTETECWSLMEAKGDIPVGNFVSWQCQCFSDRNCSCALLLFWYYITYFCSIMLLLIN